MCTRSILCKNSRLNVLLHRTEKCCSNHSNAVNRSTKNVCDEVNFELLVTGKHEIDEVHFQLLTGKHEIPEGEEFEHINAVCKYVKSIEVAIIFVICFIFACIVYCVITNVMQNKVDAIQQFVVSSSVYLLSFVHAPQSQILPNKSESTLPDSENGKSSRLSVHVIAAIDSKSETLVTKEYRSRYAKSIVIEVRYNRHVGRRDREPSSIPAKKLSRF